MDDFDDEIICTYLLVSDPKHVNKIYQSFSVVTNTRQLVTYTAVPGAIECLDGMRAISMIWIVVGHTHLNQLYDTMANPLDFIDVSFYSAYQGPYSGEWDVLSVIVALIRNVMAVRLAEIIPSAQE